MSVSYQVVLWNNQKKIYDLTLWLLIVVYLVSFVVLQFIFFPEITIETLIIRAFGSLAFIMLHLILMIGPLTRLSSKFLPLLYNRRHLGVSMFLIAAVHGVFSIIQFHALGDTFPLVSIFTANMNYNSLVNFPFQVLGFFALLILFIMAATSHDFWLKNLGVHFWKSLHMMVYIAYGLILFHVMLGVVQVESSLWNVILVSLGLLIVLSLHIVAGWKEWSKDRQAVQLLSEGWYRVAKVDEFLENQAKIITVDGNRVAIFKLNDQFAAVSNVCKHQGGPLGEGRIVDGCITCPWHGYQYLPENGCSPPPFKEKIATYDVKIEDLTVYVNAKAYPEGTARPLVKSKRS